MLFCHLLWCVGPKDRSLSVRTLYCPVQEAEDTEVRIHRGHSQVLRWMLALGQGGQSVLTLPRTGVRTLVLPCRSDRARWITALRQDSDGHHTDRTSESQRGLGGSAGDSSALRGPGWATLTNGGKCQVGIFK